ncbi:hypothetical protein E4U21_007763 [Claviceps maximensis]|nr:hypothetical protein E4U21_007763 [Claviceps maximensis]
MEGEHSPLYSEQASKRASTDSEIPSRQPGAQPQPGNATLKRKHGDDHKSSRTQRVGRFSSKESLGDLPQEDEHLGEDESEADEAGEDGPREEGETEDSSQQEAPSRWRAILSFHDMIKDPASAGQKFKAMDAEQKLIIALGVRNLFLATSTSKDGTVRDRDRQILEHMQRMVGDVADPAIMKDSGLRVSFFPCSRYTKLRHFQDLDVKIGEHPYRNYFAQVVKTPRVFAAFVDAQE